MMKKLFSLLTAVLFATSIWAETATITFSNQSTNSDSNTAYTTSNFVSSGIASSDAAFGTISCSATSRCYAGKSGMGMKVAAASNAGSYTISFSTALPNVSKITINQAAYNSSNDVTITVKNGNTTLGTVATGTTTSLNNKEITDLEIASLSTLTVSAPKYCYIKSITITYAPAGPALSSIAVKTPPTKTAYSAGEYFNPAGLVITRTYSDASTSDVTYANHESDFSFAPSTSTALTTENTSVTITYGGKSTSQAITVSSCTSSITISKGTPENGTFDITGTGDVCIDGGDASVTISNIVPADGYRFKEITSSNGGTIDNSAKTVTNISATTTINVVFELIPEVHAEANDPDFGSVVVNGTTITATPAECYRVKSGNGGYAVIEGEAIVSHTGTSNTLTVDPVNECTIQVIFEKNVNIYKDNIQGTETFEDCSTKAPKLADKTIAKTGSCTQQHFHFVGWVSEANISNITPQNVKTAGSNITVNGTTYYAVWAKYASGDIYTISIDGAGLQAVVKNQTSGYDDFDFDVEGYTFHVSAATKNTQPNTSNWFQLKKNNDAISIPELPGRITNISSSAISDAGNSGYYSNSVHFSSTNSTAQGKVIASETLSGATSFSLDIDSDAKEGYFLAGAAICINQLSVSYSTIEYTDSIAVCCKNSITIDSEIANGSVEADKEEACAGDVITLTATPASNNYRFGSWNVKDADEGDVTVTNNKFTMPAKAVTVSATFTEKADAGLTWKIGEDEVDEATVTYGGSSNIYPTLYNPHSLSTGITYSSYDGDVASFADASVYEITLNAVGETIITASFAGNEEYKSQEVSYYLTVTDKATGIEDVETSVKAVKVLRNGILLIEQNGHTYNAMGQLIK